MFSKTTVVSLGIVAGTLFGVGLGMGVFVGSRWSGVVRSIGERVLPGRRKQVRYVAFQQ